MKSILLIGLNHFGTMIAKQLHDLGHQVLAVDRDEARVNAVLPIVTISTDFQSSLETTSLLKELGGKLVVSRADREVQAKLLFDTNLLLQKAECADDVIRITAQQVKTLLDRDVVFLPLSEHKAKDRPTGLNISPYGAGTSGQDENEAEIAEWSFLNQTAAGAHTDRYGEAKSFYHLICINGYCYGVIAIYLNGERLEAFEYNVFVSIIGECALALEGLRNDAEKEQAAIAVRNEQLRQFRLYEWKPEN